MTQQTAVEWLAKEIYARGPIGEPTPTWLKELYDKANELHEKQIWEAYGAGQRNGYDYRDGFDTLLGAEDYYNKTYGK